MTEKKNLMCPCGLLIQGKDEDDLVAQAKEHLKERHPQLADVYDREDILFIAF